VPEAFIHRTTGEVVFIREGDAVALQHFAEMPLGKLRAAVASSAEWLAVPKHNGRPIASAIRSWIIHATVAASARGARTGIRIAHVSVSHGSPGQRNFTMQG